MNDFEIVPQKIRVRGLFFVALSASFCALLRLTGFHDLFRNDAEGVGALLAIIGTLYSVVYAFATYVIWGQFAAVEDEIVKESGALKDLILFSRPLHDTVRDPIVRAVRGYARGVIESEWGLLSRRENTERTDHLFSNVISSVTEAKPSDEPESRVHNLLLKIAKQASAHREERLAVSAKRMPRTLLLFVSVTALTIPLLLLFYPFHNLALGMVAIGIATMLLSFAHFVLTDLDNPFEGTWNVDSDAFNDLASKCR